MPHVRVVQRNLFFDASNPRRYFSISEIGRRENASVKLNLATMVHSRESQVQLSYPAMRLLLLCNCKQLALFR
ncbi:MAG: hypothetical protein EZS28_022846 [Streblomastix strix]|uniref:Uncharacterized protein n=1 Tax=Streblomastix strix TaxID=222440 RepID=A0A5J4VGL8_9EUKA|nr:MAG: hypothetical protein EZS28_022846 [Streblomastix strix]